MAVAKGGSAVKYEPLHSGGSALSFFFLPRRFLVMCHRGRAGSLWENRQCLICYDMNTQLDHRVQILQSAVRCQAALRGSSSGSEPVTHHIKITGESEAFFLSDQFTLQEMATRKSPLHSYSLFKPLCFCLKPKCAVRILFNVVFSISRKMCQIF